MLNLDFFYFIYSGGKRSNSEQLDKRKTDEDDDDYENEIDEKKQSSASATSELDLKKFKRWSKTIWTKFGSRKSSKGNRLIWISDFNKQYMKNDDERSEEKRREEEKEEAETLDWWKANVRMLFDRE